MNPDRRRFEREIAVRRPRSPEQATERARRGAQLCRDVLAGGHMPPSPQTPEQDTTNHQIEYVACAGCYKPILAVPGARCPACEPSELETPNA